jgi:hypothetical protein
VIRELQKNGMELDIAATPARHATICAARPWAGGSAAAATESLSRPRKFLGHQWDKQPQGPSQHRNTLPLGVSRSSRLHVAKQGLKLQWIQLIAGQP